MKKPRLSICCALISILYQTRIASAAIDPDILARLACQIQGESHLYDLRDLEADHDYHLDVKQSQSEDLTLYFNFCKQISGKDESVSEEWCLSDETKTFAYIKDSINKQCYPLTTASLYPETTEIEHSYNPQELTLTYESETQCPYEIDDQVFMITYFFECQSSDSP